MKSEMYMPNRYSASAFREVHLGLVYCFFLKFAANTICMEACALLGIKEQGFFS